MKLDSEEQRTLLAEIIDEVILNVSGRDIGKVAAKIEALKKAVRVAKIEGAK